MDIYVLILRLIHIPSAIFWVGTSLFFVFFLTPTIKAAGPAGGTVMGRLVMTKFPLVMSITSILTVLAGFLLYLDDSKGFQASFITTLPGISLTVGALAGIISFILGAIVQMSIVRMAGIQKNIQAAGAPPTPTQMEELNKLQARLVIVSRWGAVFMIIAMIGMESARELGKMP